jgi:hypothetical protein
MKRNLLRSVKGGLAAVVFALSTLVMPVTMASAAPANNGTLKVHEFGTPSGTQSNDPKVCAFNFEGFGFDPAQDGYIIVETQPGGVSSLAPSLLPFGPADASGFYATSYVNNGGTYSLPNGHYKATLYGKDTGNPAQPDLKDVKAKSKVFKVDCTASPTPVTAADVTFADLCATVNDTYTVPSSTGVIYQLGGNNVVAGTYPGSGTVSVDATDDIGYVLTGTTNWSHSYTNLACQGGQGGGGTTTTTTTVATPAAPAAQVTVPATGAVNAGGTGSIVASLVGLSGMLATLGYGVLRLRKVNA